MMYISDRGMIFTINDNGKVGYVENGCWNFTIINNNILDSGEMTITHRRSEHDESFVESTIRGITEYDGH